MNSLAVKTRSESMRVFRHWVSLIASFIVIFIPLYTLLQFVFGYVKALQFWILIGSITGTSIAACVVSLFIIFRYVELYSPYKR
jgi:hypothetical protein